MSPLIFYAQTLTGLWTGALSNDSNTVRKDQSFEIALTEYRGKVYGYSRSEFIVNDTLYYVVKRVKGTIEGDICEVIDDEIIAYNFRGRLDKGVKVTSTFRRNKSDSAWYLAGTWKTNATKKYYSVTGKVDLEEEKDLTASKIFPHLEELKLANEVAFYKDRKEGQPIVKIAKPEKLKPVYTVPAEQVSLNTEVALATKAPVLQRAEVPAATTPGADKENGATAETENNEEIIAIKKPGDGLPKTETKTIPGTTVNLTPAVNSISMAKNKEPEKIAAPVEKADVVVVTTIPEKKHEITEPINKPARQNPPLATKQPDPRAIAKTTTPVLSTTPVKTNPETKKPESVGINSPGKKEIVTAAPLTTTIPVIKKPEVEKDVTTKAATISGRKSEFTQVVNFKSDSLILSLYDNGEIDGDTVSVFMNGEVLMAKQGLKATAIKKTIYVTNGDEDFSLVLFAENLGKYPPNTGLLVVRDGDDIYNLRFSSDFQRNAGIVFRRKK